LTEQDLDVLVKQGFLIARRDTSADDVMWFAHPQMGAIVKALLKARKAVIAAISRTRYKELDEKALKKLSFPLGFDFHMHDIRGMQLVKHFKAPDGSSVYRLAKKA